MTEQVTWTEKDLGELIDQRDAAQDAITEAYEAVLGESPEWSNLFGYGEAVAAIHAKMGVIEDEQALFDEMAELLEESAQLLELFLGMMNARHEDAGHGNKPDAEDYGGNTHVREIYALLQRIKGSTSEN